MGHRPASYSVPHTSALRGAQSHRFTVNAVSFSCPACICFLLLRVPCTPLEDMYYPPSLRPLNLGWRAGGQETQAGNQSAKFPSTRAEHLTQVHSVSVSLSPGTFQACTTNLVSQEHHSLRTELGLNATNPDLGPYLCPTNIPATLGGVSGPGVAATLNSDVSQVPPMSLARGSRHPATQHADSHLLISSAFKNVCRPCLHSSPHHAH